MTLGTTIRIPQPVNPERLLDHLTVLVGGDPATVRRHCGPGFTRNAVGQGLAAIVEVAYGLDGPLPGRVHWMGPEEPDWPLACVAVYLDTYGYRGPNGEDCEELHLRLAQEIATFAGGPVWVNIDAYDEWVEMAPKTNT